MGEGGVLSGNLPNDPKNALPLLLIQIILIIIVCRALAFSFKYIRQPTVIAEVIGGIVLGPSLLGRIPGFTNTFFPPASMPNLNLIANLGLIFYMFLVGLELDIGMMRTRFKESFAISVAGMVFPFAISVGTVYFVYITYLSEGNFSFGVIFLFLGMCLAITAFPVLARILDELRLFSTPVGVQVISAAGFDDATAWSFLAIVIAIVHATSPLNGLWVILMTLGFAAIMLFIIKPLLVKVLSRGIASDGSVNEWVVILILVLILVAGLITDTIGVHSIFGAFLTGLACPRTNGFDIALTEKIEDLIVFLFLPLYFAYSGLRTDLGLMDNGMAWATFFLVTATAFVGKVGGCSIAARFMKMNWRESLAVGVLMNTKGLVELIVLNIGLDASVINPIVFAIFVLEAIFNTVITVPLMALVYPQALAKKSSSDEELTPMDSLDQIFKNKFKPLICLPGLRFVPSMMNVIQMITHEKEDVEHQVETVHTVRMIESSERTSSIIKATHQLNALESDPVLQVFKTFGKLNNIGMHAHISMASLEEMATDLCTIADSNQLNMIMIPWQHTKDAKNGLDYTSSHNHHHFVVKSLVKKWPKPVAIILDRGFSVQEEKFTIFVPFFGGPDDREAVRLALRMGNHPGTIIKIVHIKLNLEEDLEEKEKKAEKDTEKEKEDKKEDKKEENEKEASVNEQEETLELVDHGSSSSKEEPEKKEKKFSIGSKIPVDKEDEKLLQFIKNLAAHLEVTDENGVKLEQKNYATVLYAEETVQGDQCLQPVLEYLKMNHTQLVIFGFMGSKWAKNMKGLEEIEALNQKTINSTILKNISQLVHGQTALNVQGHHHHQVTTQAELLHAYNPQSTIRSLKSALGVKEKEKDSNLELNQYTVPRLNASMLPANLQGSQESATFTSTASASHPSALQVMGEVGEAIFSGNYDCSLIAVRKLPVQSTKM